RYLPVVPCFQASVRGAHAVLLEDAGEVRARPHEWRSGYGGSGRQRHHESGCGAARARVEFRVFFPIGAGRVDELVLVFRQERVAERVLGLKRHVDVELTGDYVATARSDDDGPDRVGVAGGALLLVTLVCDTG